MEDDPFLRWRLARADNARTVAAIAETCARIAEGQAAQAQALMRARERLDADLRRGAAAAVKGRPAALL